MSHGKARWPRHCGRVSQRGAGLLGIIAIIGLVLAMVQGSLYYRSKTSQRFLGSERSKLLSQQIAEAGVEEIIADLGSRRLKVDPGMTQYVTYADRALGAGTYTTKVTAVATGPQNDTVDLYSQGIVSSYRQAITARLGLRKFLDTTFTPRDSIVKDTSISYPIRDVARNDTTIQDPIAMPAVNTTPAYTACMASAASKCDVCHLFGADVTTAVVVNQLKATIATGHGSHQGDYVTTDGTCDIYKPKVTTTYVTQVDTLLTILDRTVYDTTVSVDTAVKVQILSWK